MSIGGVSPANHWFIEIRGVLLQYSFHPKIQYKKNGTPPNETGVNSVY